MLAYLFLNLFVGFKKCWKENSSSGWTSCRTERLEQLGSLLITGGGRWGNGGLEEGWVCTILMIPFIGTYNLLAMTDPAALFLPKNQMTPPPPPKKKNNNLPPPPKATKSGWSLRRVKTANGNRLPEENAKQRQSMKRTTCTKYSSEKPWSPSMCIRSTCLSKSSIGTGWRPCK